MADYTVYYMNTPNGQKITLALEEMGLSYVIKHISMANGDQFKPDFVKINPNSKIPALVDHTADGGDLVIFESGAILEYLADKTGKFIPPMMEIRKRMAVKQWLYWQMAGFGPILGQVAHFYLYAKEDIPYGKNRYMTEMLRLFGVLDKQLRETGAYMAGEYSIADMATYWWARGLLSKLDEATVTKFDEFESIKRWMGDMSKREAVIKAAAIE
eukprot:GFKZ01012227.1.p2 GENE.GFKZ01012227.1~~GFKZ01012227.1.p2  ORF type:complete len:214 (+),score=41.55 GFKZ01012227.1:237-878(+)